MRIRFFDREFLIGKLDKQVAKFSYPNRKYDILVWKGGLPRYRIYLNKFFLKTK